MVGDSASRLSVDPIFAGAKEAVLPVTGFTDRKPL